VLIVTSDHGELFGEHGYINHGATVWKELFDTPCLIRYPKRIAAGAMVNRLTSALDLVPTIFDLIDRREWLEARTLVDGQPIDFSSGTDERALVLDSPPVVLPERFKKYPNTLYKLTVLFRAVRTSRWKYLWQSNGERRLFNVRDPEDAAHDCLAGESSVADALHAKMECFYRSIDPGYDIAQYPVVLSRTVGARMTNPVVREELRRLGYL
jgi:arylsulfatase A-like enzyme